MMCLLNRFCATHRVISTKFVITVIIIIVGPTNHIVINIFDLVIVHSINIIVVIIITINVIIM